MPGTTVEQLTDSEVIAQAKDSNLRKTRFEEAAALVLKFNDPETSQGDKCYLKTVMSYILQAFDQQPIKNKRPFNVLMHLSQAHDEEIFRGVITHIAKVCSGAGLVNHYAIQGLAQILWENASKDESKDEKSYELSSTEITALLELVNNKLENNIASLNEFNRLLDAIVDSKVVGIPQSSINAIKEKLDTWLKLTKDERLKYKLAYAKQALLRVGSDTVQADIWKRRAYAFLEGVRDFGTAAAGVAGAAASFGATAAFAAPGIVLKVIDGCKNMSVAFSSSGKKEWYKQFRDLQAALALRVFYKDKLRPKDHKELKQAIDKLKDKDINSHTRLAVVDMLAQIIAQHSDETLQDNCLEVLVSYYNDTKHNHTWLKERILTVFAELSRLKMTDGSDHRVDIEVLGDRRDELTAQVGEKSAPDAYSDILKMTQAREDFMEPTPLAVDIVILGQLKANVDIDGDVMKPARKLFVSIYEPGAHFDGLVVGCSATGIALNAKPGTSQEEIDNLAKAANKVLDSFTDVCVYVVPKDVSGKATLAFNEVAAISVGTKPQRSQAEIDAAKDIALDYMAKTYGISKVEKINDKLKEVNDTNANSESAPGPKP